MVRSTRRSPVAREPSRSRLAPDPSQMYFILLYIYIYMYTYMYIRMYSTPLFVRVGSLSATAALGSPNARQSPRIFRSPLPANSRLPCSRTNEQSALNFFAGANEGAAHASDGEEDRTLGQRKRGNYIFPEDGGTMGNRFGNSRQRCSFILLS